MVRSVYDCSVDFDAIAVNDILDIHKYSIKKKKRKKKWRIIWNI